MVTRLRRIIFTKALQCGPKEWCNGTIMPKRSLQCPPEKKLKPNQGSSNLCSKTTAEQNLNVCCAFVDTMPSENQPGEEQCSVAQKPRPNVTYLEAPVKSENDKKEYR